MHSVCILAAFTNSPDDGIEPRAIPSAGDNAYVLRHSLFPSSMTSTTESVFWEESASVDIQKIKHIPKITGTEYLTKFRLKVILTFIKIRFPEYQKVSITGQNIYNIIKRSINQIQKENGIVSHLILSEINLIRKIYIFSQSAKNSLISLSSPFSLFLFSPSLPTAFSGFLPFL
jgi:hypothetical protein